MFFCEIFFTSSTSNAKKYVSFSIGGSKGVLSLNCTFCDFFAYCIIKFLYFIHEINFTKNIFFFFSENFFFVNSISRNFFYVYNLNNLTNVSMRGEIGIFSLYSHSHILDILWIILEFCESFL